MTLIEYLKNERGAVSATPVSGPNGEFIRATMKDDGTAIATINNYKDGETLTL